jgi:aquaporin TIP/aquaporin related protein
LESKLREAKVDPHQKAFWDLVRIFIFELMGTAIFAYGIVASRGSDYMISAYLYAGIFISAKFTGGHVSINFNHKRSILQFLYHFMLLTKSML